MEDIELILRVRIIMCPGTRNGPVNASDAVPSNTTCLEGLQNADTFVGAPYPATCRVTAVFEDF